MIITFEHDWSCLFIEKKAQIEQLLLANEQRLCKAFKTETVSLTSKNLHVLQLISQENVYKLTIGLHDPQTNRRVFVALILDADIKINTYSEMTIINKGRKPITAQSCLFIPSKKPEIPKLDLLAFSHNPENMSLKTSQPGKENNNPDNKMPVFNPNASYTQLPPFDFTGVMKDIETAVPSSPRHGPAN